MKNLLSLVLVTVALLLPLELIHDTVGACEGADIRSQPFSLTFLGFNVGTYTDDPPGLMDGPGRTAMRYTTNPLYSVIRIGGQVQVRLVWLIVLEAVILWVAGLASRKKKVG